MKRKTIVTMLGIGIMSVGVIFYADLTRANTISVLSDQEMAQVFGKINQCCTLGSDDQVTTCYENEVCPPCKSGGFPGIAHYAAGNYVWVCDLDNGMGDGTCHQNGLQDCTQLRYCDIIGDHYPGFYCRDGACRAPDEGEEPSVSGCINLEKGDARDPYNQQMDWFCSCY